MTDKFTGTEGIEIKPKMTDWVTAKAIADRLKEDFDNVFKGSRNLMICGGLRREKPEVHDIDLVAVGSEEGFPDVMEWFASKGEKLHGGEKQAAIWLCGMKVELMNALPENVGAASLHATGSGEFNKAMRTVAMSYGLSLSQYGLKDRETGEVVCAGGFETSLFDRLGIDWVYPKDRGKKEVIDRVWSRIRPENKSEKPAESI